MKRITGNGAEFKNVSLGKLKILEDSKPVSYETWNMGLTGKEFAPECVSFENVVQKSLDKLSIGRTALTIAHRLATVKNCDNIVVLTDEGIMESGTHDELINLKGLYSKLYKN